MSQIFSVTLVLLLICGVLYLFWQSSSLVDEYFKYKQRRLFREDLTMAILNKSCSFTLQHMQQIAETRSVTQQDIQKTLKVLLREVLTDRNISLQPHQTVIETFISNMKDREPFEGLPNEIRIHLDRLKDELKISSERLEPLTIQIRELVSINTREKKVQKYYTVGGFVLGVVGLGFAAYTYYVPPGSAIHVSKSSQAVLK